MIMSDEHIRRAIESGEIVFSEPIRDEDIRPTGVRLHLADELLLPEAPPTPIDLGGTVQPKYSRHRIGEDGFVFSPRSFALASSIEHISADPGIVCQLDGRSTLARLGLMIHCSSTTIDQIHGPPRSVTFELANLGGFDLLLRAGGPVAMLIFARLTGPVAQRPHGQYAGQSGATPPRLGYRDTGGRDDE